ncbi:MAG: hypothetical protein LBQ94_04910 [Treponema sp.]|jgi:hypothetical protein|nr:hypothetical protein [Treponema sp.]
MKKFGVSLVLLAVALLVGLAFVGCDNGTTSVDTNKLKGMWKNDANGKAVGFTNFNTNNTCVE